MARIFISHASANRQQAERLQVDLSQMGHPDGFLDVENLRVGDDWEQRLYEEISRCDALLIVLTAAWLGSKWCFAEFTQARAFGKPVLPLICEPLEPKDLNAFAPQIQRLFLDPDRNRALAQLKAVLAEIDLETGGGLWPPTNEPDRNPFPGLQPFQDQDGPVFHGRDQEIRDLLELLHARRVQWGQSLVLLHGAGGVGKSSLLRAGVLPRLQRLRDQWIVLPLLRLHPSPTEALAQCLAAAYQQAGLASNWQDLLGKLQTAAAANNLSSFWRNLANDLQTPRGATGCRLLLPIDQGEEVFAIDNTNDARQFYCWLAPALDSDLPFQVLIALRSEMIERLRQESGLQARMAVYPLSGLPLDTMRDLIEKPAKAAGFTVDPALIDRARDDTINPRVLPLLGCVLRELYARSGQQRRFRLSDYEALGNRTAGESPLDRVVREKAEEALGPLANDETPAGLASLEPLRQALLQLVRSDGDRWQRQPALLSALPPQALPLLEALAKAHLLSIDPATGRVEVTHDALLRRWPRLQEWLKQARERLQYEALLSNELAIWQGTPADEQTSALLTDRKLAMGREWLRLYKSEQGAAGASATPQQGLVAFVEQSDQQAQRKKAEAVRQQQGEDRRRRLLRNTSWSLVAVCAIGAAGTGWLLGLARTAVTSAYVSLHESEVESDPLQSVIHGLAALQRHGSFRTGLALQLAVSLGEALRAPLAVTQPIRAHQNGITSLLMLSDQDWLSGGDDGRVRHWRLGRPLSATHSGGSGAVLALLTLANGDWISANSDGSLMRWRDGQPVRRLQRPQAAAGAVVSLLALPADLWVSGSAAGELLLWRGDQPLRTLLPAAPAGQGRAGGRIWSLAAAPDGRWASGDGNGFLRRWSADGEPLGAPIPTGQGQVFSLVARTGGRLVSGGSDGSLRFWSAAGQPLGRLRTRAGASVWGLVELANGELLSAGRYGTLQRWRDDGAVGKPLQTGHRGQWRLAASPDSRTVVSFGETARDDRFQAWRLVNAGQPGLVVGGGALWSLALDSQGALLSGWRDGDLRRGLRGALLGSLRGEGIWQLEMLRDGDLLSLGTEGSLRRWPAAMLSGAPATPPSWGELIEHGAGTLLSVRDHQGGWLLGDLEGRLWYWPQGKPSTRPLLKVSGTPLFSLLSLPDGWVSGWGDGKLRLQRQGRFHTLDSGQPRVLSLAMLPDGEWLSGGSDGSLQRWRDGRRAREPFASGQSAVWELIPLPDGALLSVGEEGVFSTVRHVSARWVAGQACRALAGHPILRQPWGAAADAAKLCRRLAREPYASADPLRALLRPAAASPPRTPIQTPAGLRLEWLPQPLTRLGASNLQASFLVDGQRRQAELNCRLGYWQSLPGGAIGRPDSAPMQQLFEQICGQLERLPQTAASKGRGQAFLFSPPTHVRRDANAQPLCLRTRPEELTIVADEEDWLRTDVCRGEDGRPGVVHRSEVRF